MKTIMQIDDIKIRDLAILVETFENYGHECHIEIGKDASFMFVE